MIAPLLNPIKTQEGTLYTFQSTQEDLSVTFNNSKTKFRFSKFVLLDLPKIVTSRQETGSQTNWIYDSPADYHNTNYLNYDGIEGRFLWADGSTGEKSPGNTEHNNRFAEFLQNYMFNMEALITSKLEYDRENKQNAAERIFWKSVKELGGLRFQTATSAEFNADSADAKAGGVRFVEETTNFPDPTTGAVPFPDKNYYRQVVRYIGELDVVNSVKNYQNAFSELYIHVPNKDGYSPLVLFKSEETTNVYQSKWAVASPSNNPFIEGRSSTTSPTPPLNYEAFYDHRLNVSQAGLDGFGNPALAFALYPTSISNPKESGARWFQRGALPQEDINSASSGYNISSSGPYAYYTDKYFKDSGNDVIEKIWTSPTGIKKTNRYLRSRLDGIMVDFNVDNYKPAFDKNFTRLPQLNSINESGSFEFNAVLIYYDVYDIDNPDNVATNLYGVLFLKDPIPSETFGFKFECISKFKPTGVAGGRMNGNSYGLKVNVRFDTTVEDTAVVVGVNDYNTFSFDIFMDAMLKMSEGVDNLQDAMIQINDLKIEINDLKSLIIDGNNSADLTKRIAALEEQLKIATFNFAEMDSLMALVNRNYDEILNIYKNLTSVNIAYNLDVIQGGSNILVDRQNQNRVVINSLTQAYSNIISDFSLDVNNGVTTSVNFIELGEFTNYFAHSDVDSKTATDNVYVYMDDGNINWKKGQSFRFVIKTPINFAGKSLIFLTDSKNRFNGSQPYQKIIGTVTPTSTTPVYEIVCKSESDYDFDVLSLKD